MARFDQDYVEQIALRDDDKILIASGNDIMSLKVGTLSNELRNRLRDEMGQYATKEEVKRSIMIKASKEQYKFLTQTGQAKSTTASAFYVSDFCPVHIGAIVKNIKGASGADYTFLCFYDKAFNFISRLRNETSGVDYAMVEQDIPANAVYFRACISSTGDVIYKIPDDFVNEILESVSSFDMNIKKMQYHLLGSFGMLVYHSSWSNYFVTDYFPAEQGVVVKNSIVSGGKSIAFYDEDFLWLGDNNVDSGDIILTSSIIPARAVYARANVNQNGKVYIPYNKKSNLYSIESEKKYIVSNFKYTPNTYMNGLNGDVTSTPSTGFKTTDYIRIKNNIVLQDVHGAGTRRAYLCFYDDEFNFISALFNSDAEHPGDPFTYRLESSDIPEGAVYFRATLYDYGKIVPFKQRVLTEADVEAKNGGTLYPFFDYKNALSMDKAELRTAIECASNGRCTVIFDDAGYPSLMYKIPKVSIGAFSTALGGLTDIHPAFIVDGVEKDCIYMSVFQTSLYNGHYVSWFGLEPVGRIELPNLRKDISDKGDGWHLETIYERSLLVLLTMKLNSPTPTGNTANGMSHTNPAEYCQRYRGALPGIPGSVIFESSPGEHNGHTGTPYINGTQPAAWSHNKEMWGIQDVIGGFHEICDLYKLVNGKIYIAGSNKFFKKGDDLSTFEQDWIDTGAAFDYIGENIVLNSSVTQPMTSTYYIQKKYHQIGCTEAYEHLSLDIRKKLCILLIASRLTHNGNPVFGITGRFGIANHKPLCYGVFGGAQEYPGELTTSDENVSGLGTQITGYPIDDNLVEGHNAHYNMGSRMVYIA